ncbi:hypothetical protein [Actinomadura opuntiae]|uniref:hypothetical protein n=1 Tax=Actinomadura sp. OS1-43 TaxID=604315 RepID=UPI00255B0895|nr:hypothetical protein [Actinomadura sp. OS1-43]MDL4815473.1 hypothetical protein [Actinomadura sp. OS1-43]
MKWADEVTLAASCAAAAFAAPTLWLTWLAHRRARERSDVQWQVQRVEEGVFDVVNLGRDPAFKVAVEMWTETEIESTDADKVEPKTSVRVRLPRRAGGEYAPVDLPRSMFDEVPDEPPEFPDVLSGGSMAKQAMEGWRRAKAAKDEAHAMHAALEQDAREKQVQVRITWRSKLGVWSEHTEQTG